MSSRRTPLAALAAVTAALAIAVPAATASAASPAAGSVDPTVCQLIGFSSGPFGPTMFPGGASLSNVLANAGSSVGCPAPAPQASPFPVLP
jgi:ABC-type sugar transport system substrate-binding protein